MLSHGLNSIDDVCLVCLVCATGATVVQVGRGGLHMAVPSVPAPGSGEDQFPRCRRDSRLCFLPHSTAPIACHGAGGLGASAPLVSLLQVAIDSSSAVTIFKEFDGHL